MKVLVTGGAGFIGSHIVESLVNDGHKVTVYDNLTTGSHENLISVKDEIQFIKDDILNIDSLIKAMNGVEMVSHHAAQLEIFRGSDNPEYDLDVNTKGTLNVLKAAEKCGVSKIVNASSACIYGQVDGLTPETHNPAPNWNYGVSKIAAEKYCDIYSNYHNLPVVNLRYGITYGEREWYRRVLTIFIKRAMLNEPLVVFGDGAQVRDFVYVGDVVNFHNLCIKDEIANGRSYNVGTGKATTIKQLAENVEKAADNNINIIFEETAEGDYSKLVPEKRRNSEELKIMLLDITKAKTELGWSPEVTLEEGIKREMSWLKDNMHRWEKILYTV